MEAPGPIIVMFWSLKLGDQDSSKRLLMQGPAVSNSPSLIQQSAGCRGAFPQSFVVVQVFRNSFTSVSHRCLKHHFCIRSSPTGGSGFQGHWLNGTPQHADAFRIRKHTREEQHIYRGRGGETEREGEREREREIIAGIYQTVQPP